MDLLRRVVKELSTMRAAIVLLALAALASMAGTVLVQGLPLPDYVVKFGPLWAQVLWYAGLTDVFRAWWFLGILAVLLASVSVCLWRNGPVALRAVRKRLNLVKLGYLLAHAGVLAVAAGGLLTGLLGWRGTLNLREGEADNVVLVWRGATASPRFLPFTVTNQQFEIEQYPSGMPRRYATRLRFGNGPVQAVEVNKPLHHGPYAFYQASFGDGGTQIAGNGINLLSGAVAPFKGHIYDKATIADGTRVELLDFRPFTVETVRGERPADVGPSVDYLVQPPDAPARQLRAYLNHPDIVGVADGQKVGGANDGAVVYRPVPLGLEGYRVSGLTEEEFWRLVARVADGEDFKAVAGPMLAKITDEKARVAAGLAVLQSARVVKELGLTHLLVARDFQLKRYSGLQVAYDPGAWLFWPGALMLAAGVVLMLLGRRKV